MSENWSSSGSSKWEAVGQQREIQSHANLIIQLITSEDHITRTEGIVSRLMVVMLSIVIFTVGKAVRSTYSPEDDEGGIA